MIVCSGPICPFGVWQGGGLIGVQVVFCMGFLSVDNVFFYLIYLYVQERKLLVNSYIFSIYSNYELVVYVSQPSNGFQTSRPSMKLLAEPKDLSPEGSHLVREKLAVVFIQWFSVWD